MKISIEELKKKTKENDEIENVILVNESNYIISQEFLFEHGFRWNGEIRTKEIIYNKGMKRIFLYYNNVNKLWFLFYSCVYNHHSEDDYIDSFKFDDIIRHDTKEKFDEVFGDII